MAKKKPTQRTQSKGSKPAKQSARSTSAKPASSKKKAATRPAAAGGGKSTKTAKAKTAKNAKKTKATSKKAASKKPAAGRSAKATKPSAKTTRKKKTTKQTAGEAAEKKTTQKTTKKAAGSSRKKSPAKQAASRQTATKTAAKPSAKSSNGSTAATTKAADKSTPNKSTSNKTTPNKTTPTKAGSAKSNGRSGKAASVAETIRNKRKAAARFTYTPPEAESSNGEAVELTVKDLKKVKTGLTKRDLLYFKRLLLEKRAELLGDVESMELAREAARGGDVSHMPLHMADVGSDNFEQEFMLGLMEADRKLLIEIDEALRRIQDGYYGVCLDRGVPIGRPRLEAKPWAKYCIEAVRERERRGQW